MKHTAAIPFLLAFLFVGGCSHFHKPGEPPTVNDPLQEVCAELGIQGECNGVVILSQAGHLDWDWQNWFPTMASGTEPVVDPVYFRCEMSCESGSATCNAPKPTECIFSAAEGLLTASDRYRYSVCEMAFLRAFAESSPESFARMKVSSGLRIVGGGITSPDNLLPHGEAFLRNYLVGKTWMDSVGLDWTGQIWLPDDFGHDSQLPVMLQAMAAEGVGFARVPGACDGFGQGGDRATSTAARLLGQIPGDPGGVDFFWQANDGSQTLAHWMQDHYGQGNNVARGGYLYTNPEDQATCTNHQLFAAGKPQMQALISDNRPVSPTPFIYVPVSGDFIMPIGANGQQPDLLQVVDDWNNGGQPAGGIAAMVGTFDDYVQLVSQYAELNPTRGTGDAETETIVTRSFHDPDRPFEPTPYWMGFYASRLGLKGLHFQATRNLLAAETFGALPGYLPNASTVGDSGLDLFDIWNNLAPSTHHDYITGTATDPVYNYDNPQYQGQEQLALLKKTASQSEQALQSSLAALTSQVSVSEPSLVAFNPLGMARQGLVETTDGSLACVAAPSLGYQVQSLNSSSCNDLGDVVVQFIPSRSAPEAIVLSNQHLRATITKSSNWSVSSLVDLAAPTVEIFSQPGNALVFYSDGGGLYGFGYECGQEFSLSNSVQVPSEAVQVEQETLRIRVTTQVTVGSQTFTKQYSLNAGEPMLRMTILGAAPSSTTVTTQFPLSEAVDTLIHGTPYHWDYKPTKEYRTGQVGFNSIFQATHDFVLAQTDGNNLGAIYHGLTPTLGESVTPGIPVAWAVDSKILLGVVLRNNSGSCGAGASGTDDGTHSVSYAFRLPGGIPQGLQAGTSGQLLQEARQYNTPLLGTVIPSPQSGTYPSSFSLASITQPGAAILTAAKNGTANPDDLILRIYQPTNQQQTAQLSLASTLAGQSIRVVTALETPTTDDTMTTNSGGTAEITIPRAVTTLAIGDSSENSSKR